MSCISRTNLCPASGDDENVLLQKILQSLNEGGGGGGGGGVTGIKINGGATQTGLVLITTGTGTVTSVNGDAGPAVSLDSGEIPEGANLYFTVARVRATDLTGFASALGAITATDTILSAFGKTQGRLAALEAGTAGPFLLRAGDTGTGQFLFTMSANDTVPLTLTTTAGSLTTSNNLVVNYGAANLLTLRNDGRLVLNGRAAFVTTSSIGHGFRVSDVNTASAVIGFTIGHNLSAGVGAAGIGIDFDTNLDSSTTADTRAARWRTTWTTATHATRTSDTTFNTFTAGTEQVQLVLTNGQVQSNGGTAALPAFTNRNDPDTGSYFPAANTWAVATNGVLRFSIDTAGITSTFPFLGPNGTAAAPTFSFSGDPDNGMYLPAANTLCFSAGGVDQVEIASTTLSVVAALSKTRTYESIDAGVVNYSRTTITTQAGNHLIRTEAAGTGTLRILQVGTGPSTGTDIAGVSAIFHGGQSTGTGLRGAILFQQSAPAGGSGSGVNALSTSWSIDTSAFLVPGADAARDFGTAALRVRDIRNSRDIYNGGSIAITNFTVLRSPSSGVLTVSDTSEAAFNRMQFGGTSNSFNAIGRDAVNGFTIQSAAGTATYNDASTAASGTVANRYLFGLATPTLTSTNATVTYTIASGVFIGGAPVASTNVTIGTAYALNVDTGMTRLGGGLRLPAGQVINIVSGSNQRAGNAVLVGGTVTVANTTVTANTVVMLTRKTSGGTIGTAITYTVTAATSFTITSDSVLDTSTFSYFLIEVP